MNRILLTRRLQAFHINTSQPTVTKMASSRPLPTDGPTAGGDEINDLFDYMGEDDPDDPFGNNYVNPEPQKRKDEKAAKEKGSAAGLGIDEEIEVTRKPRAPRVKLDENRLLSAAGIPKLRKKAKNHLKFKGKGHEVRLFLYNSKTLLITMISSRMPPDFSNSTNYGSTTYFPKPDFSTP